MREILLTLGVAIGAYLLGCFSTGILVSSRAGVNIRTVGSHNTGASNVLRVLGLKRGLITFLGDFAKATLACLWGSLLLPGTTFGIAGFGVMVGGLMAILGDRKSVV
jgi:glycerol-3-phosphate acyltransferase PlsY